MAKFYLTIGILFYGIGLSATSFEGSITFQKITENDTSYYTYYVKDNFVRVDEHSKSKMLLNSLLVNLDDSSLIALSPLRKMYMYMPVQSFYFYTNSAFSIQKTDETMKILNYSCKKWSVRNDSLNAEVEYFVAADEFDFFIPFLRITNRSENSAGFFVQIDKNEGYFPLRSVEHNLQTGTIKLVLEVLEIKKSTLDESLFEIPADYMLFEH